MAQKPKSEDPLIEHCRSLPAATEDVKWGNDLVFSVGGKMFAAFALPEADSLSFKVDPLLFESLAQQEGIEPAPYLARHHWIAIRDRQALPLETLQDFLEESHRLVASKLTKKLRRELGLEV